MIRPFFIHRDTLAMISLYEKDWNSDSVFFDIEHISTDEDWAVAYKESAKCFIESLERKECRAFLRALKTEIDSYLKEDYEIY